MGICSSNCKSPFIFLFFSGPLSVTLGLPAACLRMPKKKKKAKVKKTYVEGSIVKARHLPAMDDNGLSDPFVHILLDGREVFKTNVFWSLSLLLSLVSIHTLSCRSSRQRSCIRRVFPRGKRLSRSTLQVSFCVSVSVTCWCLFMLSLSHPLSRIESSTGWQNHDLANRAAAHPRV